MYKVLPIETEAYGKQWVLTGKNGDLVRLPCKFLKHIYITGKSLYTQKSYAYALKFWSDFLDEIQLDYTGIDLKDLFSFLAWLQDPTANTNIVNISVKGPARSARTVNTYIAAVMSFYRYLYSIGEIHTSFDTLYLHTPKYSGSSPAYKDFLYHTHKGENKPQSVLRVKEPRKKIRILLPKEVYQIIEATTNIRDRFLVYFLFVSGLRIGELLSLFNEDLIFDLQNGHRIKLTERGILENGGKLKTGPRLIHINQECVDLFDDYQYECLDSFNKDSNFLFVKMKGPNAGAPMNYDDVMSLFRRLSAKTGISVHPHLFRHTHATMYYAQTKDAKMLQERLGHKDVQTTINTYVHPTTGDILASWEKAAGSFKLEV